MGQSKERNSNEKSGFLKKLIIVLAVAIVVVFAEIGRASCRERV